MSRIRTYVVGRAEEADVRLNEPSVSRNHAEVVRVSDGFLYVTDCATTNGTFVLEGGHWSAIRQRFLEPTDSIRFGNSEMTAGQLEALCTGDGRNHASSPAAVEDADAAPSGSRVRGKDTLDPSRGLKRDPKTGKVIQK